MDGPAGAVRAGAATVDITPPVGRPMGGYGRRTDVSQGVNDPLLARTLVLAQGDTEVALVVCDLLGVGTDLVGATREAVGRTAGVDPDHVMVAATHTHAGPAGIRAADDAGFVNQTAERIGRAVAEARGRLGPVTLKFGETALDTVGQNRRHPDGPIEDRVRVLLADPGRTEEPVATLVNYACHSTVREHDNLEYSADWPGAMARSVERAIGGTAVYLQGAAGDVNPVWAAHDHTEVERLGGIVGAAAVRLVHEMRPLDTGQWCINLNWSEDIEVPATGRLLSNISLAAASRPVTAPRRTRAPLAQIDAERAEVSAQRSHLTAGSDAYRRLTGRLNELDTDRLFPRPAASAGAPRPQTLEVQAIRLSPDCVIVSLPGEFFVATARDIRARAGVEGLLVAGYANGSVGYVPTADQYGKAGYEVGMTQFSPGVAEQVADAAVSLVRELVG